MDRSTEDQKDVRVQFFLIEVFTEKMTKQKKYQKTKNYTVNRYTILRGNEYQKNNEKAQITIRPNKNL